MFYVKEEKGENSYLKESVVTEDMLRKRRKKEGKLEKIKELVQR